MHRIGRRGHGLVARWFVGFEKSYSRCSFKPAIRAMAFELLGVGFLRVNSQVRPPRPILVANGSMTMHPIRSSSYHTKHFASHHFHVGFELVMGWAIAGSSIQFVDRSMCFSLATPQSFGIPVRPSHLRFSFLQNSSERRPRFADCEH